VNRQGLAVYAAQTPVDLYKQRVGTHIIPAIGDLPVDAVTTDDVRRLAERLGRTRSAATTSGVLVVVSSLMRYPVRAKLIERNPIRDLDRDDRPGVKRQTEPRYLDADEVRLLLSTMGDTFRPVASVCAYSGLRVSETLGLALGRRRPRREDDHRPPSDRRRSLAARGHEDRGVGDERADAACART
jgi:integrase